MPSLPPSAMSVLQFNDAGDLTLPLARDVKVTAETPWVLAGEASTDIAIVKPSKTTTP